MNKENNTTVKTTRGQVRETYQNGLYEFKLGGADKRRGGDYSEKRSDL